MAAPAKPPATKLIVWNIFEARSHLRANKRCKAIAIEQRKGMNLLYGIFSGFAHPGELVTMAIRRGNSNVMGEGVEAIRGLDRESADVAQHHGQAASRAVMVREPL
jgi:hypothetical protein